MSKTRARKEQEVEKIAQTLQANKLTVMATFEGVKVKDAELLRREMRQQQSELVMSKKTLLQKALQGMKVADVDLDAAKGNLGLAFSPDEVTAAKAIKQFAKTHPQVVMVGAVLEGKALTAAETVALANLPSRLELIAKTVYVIKSPLSGLVNVCQGNIRGLVQAMRAIADAKQSA
ncbi:MAG: 50S ribosomal protein L10 [Patescibacteria group bacterium]|jgi:large subunit ribosomal protein L10